jgi:hypothetical protein
MAEENKDQEKDKSSEQPTGELEQNEEQDQVEGQA